MNDFKLGQDFVTKVTQDDEPDISVIGTSPTMTIEEINEEVHAWHKAEYVRLFVEVGVDAETAAGWHDEQWPDMLADQVTPEEAFRDETDLWTDDGDLA